MSARALSDGAWTNWMRVDATSNIANSVAMRRDMRMIGVFTAYLPVVQVLVHVLAGLGR